MAGLGALANCPGGSPTVAYPLLPPALPTSGSSDANGTAESVAGRGGPLEAEPGLTIVILLIYRTLGGLLPARYQAERRSVRYD